MKTLIALIFLGCLAFMPIFFGVAMVKVWMISPLAAVGLLGIIVATWNTKL